MRTIASEWDKFVALVLPTDAPPIQRQEMRRAFYSGAEAFMRLQYDMGHESVSEDQAMAMMQAWHEEAIAFAADIARGKA